MAPLVSKPALDLEAGDGSNNVMAGNDVTVNNNCYKTVTNNYYKLAVPAPARLAIELVSNWQISRFDPRTQAVFQAAERESSRVQTQEIFSDFGKIKGLILPR